MKTVVSLQELVDAEIRPGGLIEEFHRLTAEAVATLIRGPLTDAPCPACSSRSSAPAFDKLGLSYRQCDECASLYVSPRPSAAALAAYHSASAPAAFWRDRILPATRDARTTKLAGPRAEWVVDGLTEHRRGAESGVDASPTGTLVADTVATMQPSVRCVSVDALVPGHSVGGAASADFVLAFDVLDRIADPRTFIDQVHSTLTVGGILFLTAPSISGFDLQVLWDRSSTITPPDKLNLLSMAGLRRLFAAPQWEIIELSTPGMFDVENVRRALLADPAGPWPRVVREMVMQENEQARLELQEYLQRYRLASFARLIVRRT